MHTGDIKKIAAEHKKARISSLVHQIKQVNAEIHSVVDKVEEDANRAKVIEGEIKEKRALASNNLTAAIILISDAESKIKDIKEEEIIRLSLEANPSKGLEGLITCYLYLLADVVPRTTLEINMNKQPKETNWKACQRLLRDGKTFLDGLKNVREKIDNLEIQNSNIECVKLIIGESFFDFEKLNTDSKVLSNIYSYLQELISYYDLIFISKMNQKETSEATARLVVSSERLLQDEEEMQKLHGMSNQLYAELGKATSEP